MSPLWVCALGIGTVIWGALVAYVLNQRYRALESRVAADGGATDILRHRLALLEDRVMEAFGPVVQAREIPSREMVEWERLSRAIAPGPIPLAPLDEWAAQHGGIDTWNPPKPPEPIVERPTAWERVTSEDDDTTGAK